MMTEYNQRAAFFEKNNCDVWKTEVPVYSRSVDAVILNKKDFKLTAIEFKLNNWKKVIEQAMNVTSVFDYVVICIMEPKRNSTRMIIENECSKLGIGLIFSNFLNGIYQFKEIIKPIEQKRIWKIQKKIVFDYLEGK